MNEVSFLRSDALWQAGFRHAFFTRAGGVSEGPYATLNFSVTAGDRPRNVARNLEHAAGVLGVRSARLYFLSQVHGASVHVVDGSERRDEVLLWEGDAVASVNPRVACGVRIADCMPILVGDTQSGAAVAIHAGWRGLVQGVIAAGVERLRTLGSARSRLIAALGPHISRRAFEVGDDVARALAECSEATDVVDTGFGRRPHVDLRRIARAQLRRAGLVEQDIDDVAGCTFSDPSRFFSYRRDGRQSGRHLAAIVPRAP